MYGVDACTVSPLLAPYVFSLTASARWARTRHDHNSSDHDELLKDSGECHTYEDHLVPGSPHTEPTPFPPSGRLVAIRPALSVATTAHKQGVARFYDLPSLVPMKARTTTKKSKKFRRVQKGADMNSNKNNHARQAFWLPYRSKTRGGTALFLSLYSASQPSAQMCTHS